jgi:hypothetical protein
VLWSFLDPCSKASTSASRLETGFRESSWSPYVCDYVEVPFVRCQSHCAKFFTALRSATSSSTATLVWERNLRISVFEGACPKLLTITGLLIDRSLGNRGCVAHNFFLLSASNPNIIYMVLHDMLSFFSKDHTFLCIRCWFALSWDMVFCYILDSNNFLS